MKNGYQTLIVIIIVLNFFQSCSFQYHKIDSKVKNWIPYKPGNKIIFQSSKGKVDILFILKKEGVKNPKKQWAIISDYYEKIIIEAKIPDSFTNPMGTHFSYSYQSLMIIDANKNSTTIEIEFKPYSFYFKSSGNTFESISLIKRLKLGNKEYDDITVFECNNNKFCTQEKVIKKLYWSMKYGIVQFALGEEEWNFKEIILE